MSHISQPRGFWAIEHNEGAAYLNRGYFDIPHRLNLKLKSYIKWTKWNTNSNLGLSILGCVVRLQQVIGLVFFLGRYNVFLDDIASLF